MSNYGKIYINLIQRSEYVKSVVVCVLWTAKNEYVLEMYANVKIKIKVFKENWFNI